MATKETRLDTGRVQPAKDKGIYNISDVLKLKMIEDPAMFLFETGILYKINKAVLHPLGYALAIGKHENGEMSILGLIDYTTNPQGATYTKEAFEVGRQKFKRHLQEKGSARLKMRKQALGYVFQGE
jgi:hypothetical protein